MGSCLLCNAESRLISQGMPVLPACPPSGGTLGGARPPCRHAPGPGPPWPAAAGRGGCPLQSVWSRLQPRRRREGLLRPAPGRAGTADAYRRHTPARLAALVPRPPSHQLRRRLDLPGPCGLRPPQPGRLLCQLHAGLSLLPELAVPPHRPAPGAGRQRGGPVRRCSGRAGNGRSPPEGAWRIAACESAGRRPGR